MMLNCVGVDDDKDTVGVFCELLNMIKLDVLVTWDLSAGESHLLDSRKVSTVIYKPLICSW